MAMKMIRLPDGLQGSVPGQAAWMMAERGGRRAAGIAASQEGIDPRLTLVDTVEIHCEGEVGRLTEEAIPGGREQVFLVSNGSPQNTSAARLHRAFEARLWWLKRTGLPLPLQPRLRQCETAVMVCSVVEQRRLLGDAGLIWIAEAEVWRPSGSPSHACGCNPASSSFSRLQRVIMCARTGPQPVLSCRTQWQQAWPGSFHYRICRALDII